MSASSPDPKEKKPSVNKVAKLVPVEAVPLKTISFAKSKKGKKKDKNGKEADPETNNSDLKMAVARSASERCLRTERLAFARCPKTSVKPNCHLKDANYAAVMDAIPGISMISTSTHQRSTRITR